MSIVTSFPNCTSSCLVGNGLHCDESLEEKVEALEGKVSQQTCEIVLLKSALADVLRRLCVVEETSKRHKGRV